MIRHVVEDVVAGADKGFEIDSIDTRLHNLSLRVEFLIDSLPHGFDAVLRKIKDLKS